jgi:hypothetical protein
MTTATRLRAVGLALVTGAASAIVALTPSPASASCSHAHSNLDGAGSGRVSASALTRRSGPHTTCGALGQAGNGVQIFYHCFTIGENVDGINTWTWGRIAGTSQEGWFWDGGLNNGGSLFLC